MGFNSLNQVSAPVRTGARVRHGVSVFLRLKGGSFEGTAGLLVYFRYTLDAGPWDEPSRSAVSWPATSATASSAHAGTPPRRFIGVRNVGQEPATTQNQ